MTTAVVTGTSSGIGYATALRLAQDGFDVVATMRKPDVGTDDLLRSAADSGAVGRLRVLPLAPPRDSPYRSAVKNWGLAVGWEHERGSDPNVVADRIAELVADSDPPLRNPLALGCVETIEIRAQHSDAAWAPHSLRNSVVGLAQSSALRGAEFG